MYEHIMVNFVRICNYDRHLIINQFFFLTIFNVNEALEVSGSCHYSYDASVFIFAMPCYGSCLRQWYFAAYL